MSNTGMADDDETRNEDDRLDDGASMTMTEWTPGPLIDRAQHIGLHLAQWRDRANRAAQREAACHAVGQIDAMLRELATLRQQLVGEIGAFDRAAALMRRSYRVTDPNGLLAGREPG